MDFDVGSLSASLTYVWRDATYYDVFNRYYNKVKAFDQTDARLVFNAREKKYTVIGYVKNITDSRGSTGISASRINAISANEGFVNETISYINPRTYGVEVQYRF